MNHLTLTERARAALTDESHREFDVVRVHYLTQNNEGGGNAPKHMRPKVLIGHSMPGDGWSRAFSFIPLMYKIICNDFAQSVDGTMDPKVRERRREKRSEFFGSWASLAGQWVAAAQPLSSGGVATVLTLTETDARYIYWQKRRWGEKLGEAHEMGPTFSRDSIAWTRRNYKKFPQFQVGFTDGSWGTIMVPDEDIFLKHFPHTLSHKDPIP